MVRGRVGMWLGGLLVCSLAGGCDFVFRLDHVGGTADAGKATGDGNVDRCFQDDFTGPTVCAPWGMEYHDLGATISEAGALVITPAAQVNSIAGCTSLTDRPFGSGVTVAVTDIVRGLDTYTALQLHGPDVQINATDNDHYLHFQRSTGVDLSTPVKYDPTLKWWRIRPVGTDMIVGEYSMDGKIFFPLGSVAMTVPAVIGVELEAGTNQATVSGTGTFEQLLICP